MDDWGEQYLICNWNERAFGVIIQLHSDVLRYSEDARPITVIAKDRESPVSQSQSYGKFFYDVRFHEGDPSDRAVLLAAGVKQAISVLVLAGDGDAETADARTMLTFMALKKIRQEMLDEQAEHANDPATSQRQPLRVVLEFKQAESQTQRFSGLLEGTEHWVSFLAAAQVDAMLFAQASRAPGLVKLYFDILTFSRESDEVYRTPIADAWLEEHDGAPTYHQLYCKVLDLRASPPGMVLLGYVRRSTVYTNPALDTKLQRGDDLLLLAKDPPHLDDLLRQQTLRLETRE